MNRPVRPPVIMSIGITIRQSMSRKSERNQPTRSRSDSLPDIDIDLLPDPVIIADANTRQIVEANTAAEELFHCRGSDLVGRHQRDLHPSDYGDYREAFQRASDGERVNRLSNGQPLYIETLDGQRIPVEINVRRLDTSTGTFILGVFREVAEQLERERRLDATTTRLEALLDALPVPVAVLDSNGIVERWNQQAEATFGYAHESVVGEAYPLFIEDREFDELFEQILDGGMLDGYETQHRARDGSRVPVELYARPLYEDGTFSGLIGASVDLSDRKQREQQLSVLHRVLRHNLRNELGLIRGWAQTLEPEHSETVDTITAASERLLALSEEATRIRAGLKGNVQTPSSTSITETLSHLSEQVDERDTATLTVATEPESAAICRRGKQAVSQLLESVLEHTETPAIELAAETYNQHVVLKLMAPTSVLPPGTRSFVRTGSETALSHSDDLQVTKAYLIIESLGGNVTIPADTGSASANALLIELPRMDVGNDSPEA